MHVSVRRITTAATAAVITAGLAVVLWGVWKNDPARAAGGACLTITSLTFIALVVIRRWVTDTSAERAGLAATGKQRDDERSRYIAAQAAMAVDRDRMRRDAEYAAEQAAAQLEAERVKLRREFDEERNELVCKSFAAAFEILKSGLPDDAATRGRAVIPFPDQRPAGGAARARGRDVSR